VKLLIYKGFTSFWPVLTTQLAGTDYTPRTLLATRFGRYWLHT